MTREVTLKEPSLSKQDQSRKASLSNFRLSDAHPKPAALNVISVNIPKLGGTLHSFVFSARKHICSTMVFHFTSAINIKLIIFIPQYK